MREAKAVPETPTDDEIIAACHSVGVDTTPSVYGFDALQMRASIPVLRNVINALRTKVRPKSLTVEDICKLVCQHTGKRINLRVDEVEQHIDFVDAVVALAREDLAECQSNEFSSRMCEAGTKGCAILHSVALTDGCTFCQGAKGGVPGNANVIGGQVVCDYCTSLLMTVKDNEKAKPSGSLFAPIREQEPDWSDSKTPESELWKNPLLSMAERLQMADGAVRFRNDVIANLRAQLSEAKAAPTREAPVELPEKPERDGNWAAMNNRAKVDELLKHISTAGSVYTDYAIPLANVIADLEAKHEEMRDIAARSAARVLVLKRKLKKHDIDADEDKNLVVPEREPLWWHHENAHGQDVFMNMPFGLPDETALIDAKSVAGLEDALRNIRDYRTDADSTIAARSMRFYAEQALADQPVAGSPSPYSNADNGVYGEEYQGQRGSAAKPTIEVTEGPYAQISEQLADMMNLEVSTVDVTTLALANEAVEAVAIRSASISGDKNDA